MVLFLNLFLFFTKLFLVLNLFLWVIDKGGCTGNLASTLQECDKWVEKSLRPPFKVISKIHSPPLNLLQKMVRPPLFTIYHQIEHNH